VQNASPQPKRKKNEVADDGDDARRAPQGVILVVLSQFFKAFGTNNFL